MPSFAAKRRGLVEVAVVAIVAGWFGRLSNAGLEVRDTSGRLRLCTEESKDGFALVVLDEQGKRRAALGTSSAKGVLCLYDGFGKPTVEASSSDDGPAAIRVGAVDGPVVRLRSDGQVCGMRVTRPDRGYSVALELDLRSELSCLSLVEPGNDKKSIELIARASGRSLLWLTEASRDAGIVVKPGAEGAALWLGNDALTDVAEGVRIAYVPGDGAGVSIFGSKGARPAVLQATVGGGSGVAVGDPQTDGAKLGISATGSPSMVLTSESKQLVRLPEK